MNSGRYIPSPEPARKALPKPPDRYLDDMAARLPRGPAHFNSRSGLACAWVRVPARALRSQAVSGRLASEPRALACPRRGLARTHSTAAGSSSMPQAASTTCARAALRTVTSSSSRSASGPAPWLEWREGDAAGEGASPVRVYGASHLSPCPDAAIAVLAHAPSCLVVETAICPPHGAKTGNVAAFLGIGAQRQSGTSSCSSAESGPEPESNPFPGEFRARLFEKLGTQLRAELSGAVFGGDEAAAARALAGCPTWRHIE